MTQKSYTVLARRYRPTRLSDLVGQDVLRSILSEAIVKNHLPHAILLHGIRGVGKTTTARIIARALNCAAPLDNGDPCGVCASCQDIQNDRHIDVVEIDAASNTSVDNIREIIDSSRYKAVKGRFKIFIIDEVHMLSKSAFNALLKTLEEPPQHVKFIFATTELRKIPDTILSRCMKFDLKRIDPTLALTHMQNICKLESVNAEENALGMIARAGDGSMRDSLSLLDQAISMSLRSDEGVTLSLVQEMLGASNKEHIFSIIEIMLHGQTDKLLDAVESLFALGANPLTLLQEILECIYWLSCLKTQPKMMNDPTWPKSEREWGARIAEPVGISVFARAWQVLSKGYEDVQKNPLQKQACVMVLIRLCHLGTLPSLERMIDIISNGSGSSTPSSQMPSHQSGQSNTSSTSLSHSLSSPSLSAQDKPANISVEQHNIADNSSHILTTTVEIEDADDHKNEASSLATFQSLIDLLNKKKEILVASFLEHNARVLHYEPGHIKMGLDTQPSAGVSALRQTLQKVTQTDWIVTIVADVKTQTCNEIRHDIAVKKLEEAKNAPIIKELLTIFPNATLTMESLHAST